jgi:hypothetical protein
MRIGCKLLLGQRRRVERMLGAGHSTVDVADVLETYEPLSLV